MREINPSNLAGFASASCAKWGWCWLPLQDTWAEVYINDARVAIIRIQRRLGKNSIWKKNSLCFVLLGSALGKNNLSCFMAMPDFAKQIDGKNLALLLARQHGEDAWDRGFSRLIEREWGHLLAIPSPIHRFVWAHGHCGVWPLCVCWGGGGSQNEITLERQQHAYYGAVQEMWLT